MTLNRPEILGTFPNLIPDGGIWKSPKTPDWNYNCIAFAAGEEHRIWWPGNADCYWPTSDEDESLENFEKAFQSIGYAVCDNELLEPGWEKVAIYVARGTVQHAIKQMPDGRWKSKLGGDLDDVEHDTLRGGECVLYGKAVRFMKRKIKNEETILSD